MTTPLGKLHRHAVDVLTIYPYHSVNSIDTLCQACNMMLVLCLVSPDPLASVSFCRFIVSLSFYRYRYRYTEIVSVGYFLSYRFQTIIPKLSVRYPFLLLLVPVSDCPCIDSAQITPSIQMGVHSPMPSGVGNDTHQTTSQSGPTAVGAGGPFLP